MVKFIFLEKLPVIDALFLRNDGRLIIIKVFEGRGKNPLHLLQNAAIY